MISLIQDLFVFVPIKLFFKNLYLPSLIRQQVRQKQQEAEGDSNDPLQVKLSIGASVRVAQKSQFQNLHVSKLILSGSTAEFEGQVKATAKKRGKKKGQKQQPQQQEQTVEPQFTRIDQKKKNTFLIRFIGFCFVCNFILIGIFLALPDDLQEAALDFILPIIFGGIIYGFSILKEINIQSLLSPIIAITACIAFWTWLQRRRARRRETKAYRRKGAIQRVFRAVLPKPHPFAAETSSIEMTGIGIEHSSEVVANDEFTLI